MSSGRLSSYARARRRVAIASAPLVLAGALAGCGGGGGTDAIVPAAHGEAAGSTATANALTLSGAWPLTGEKLDSSLPSHPVYVVKIDNTAASDPQFGLGSADMIVEELVEGGLTRLAAFFYSDLPDKVGPVRSIRASDVGIVKPAAGSIVASGGTKKVLRLISSHDISTVTEIGGSPGFYRDDSTSPPYNLFIKLDDVGSSPEASKAAAAPQSPYLPFGPADDFAGTTPVSSIAATFSGSHTTDWRYTGHGWVEQNSYAQPGDDFVADTVVLLRVRIGDAGYLDPAGNPVPKTEFFGTGQAIVVHGESALTCTWSKSDQAGQLELATTDGKPVTVPAGHTWVELVPSKTGSVTLTK
jgi:hypothetical protein